MHRIFVINSTLQIEESDRPDTVIIRMMGEDGLVIETTLTEVQFGQLAMLAKYSTYGRDSIEWVRKPAPADDTDPRDNT